MAYDPHLPPDQPSPEARPPVEEEPLPVIETMPDYPAGVERIVPVRPVLVERVAQAPPTISRRKPAKTPADWEAKKRMLLLCLLLLVANLCVGGYLLLTRKNREPRPPTTKPVTPVKERPQEKQVPVPARPGDVGMRRVEELLGRGAEAVG